MSEDADRRKAVLEKIMEALRAAGLNPISIIGGGMDEEFEKHVQFFHDKIANTICEGMDEHNESGIPRIVCMMAICEALSQHLAKAGCILARHTPGAEMEGIIATSQRAVANYTRDVWPWVQEHAEAMEAEEKLDDHEQEVEEAVGSGAVAKMLNGIFKRGKGDEPKS